MNRNMYALPAGWLLMSRSEQEAWTAEFLRALYVEQPEPDDEDECDGPLCDSCFEYDDECICVVCPGCGIPYPEGEPPACGCTGHPGSR